MFTQLDDHNPLSNSLPEQRAATMARGRMLRRRRQGVLLGAVGAAAVLVVVTSLTLPRTLEAVPDPVPASTPLPEPTGPSLEMYPLCTDDCPTSQPAARYRSLLSGDKSEVPFTVVLPAGWHSLGGDYPDGYGYYPRGSRSFSTAGDVYNADEFGVSLVANDGRSGMVLIPNPTVVTEWPDGGGFHYAAPPGGYASWLASLSPDTRPAARTVGGYEATAVDLAAFTGTPPASLVAGGGGCRVAWACAPVVSYHIPPAAGGGSGPPTMGRLPAPTRLVLVTVPNSAEPFHVVIWLWDVGTNGASTGEVLRNVQPILDTLRFEGPRPLTPVG